MDSTPTINPLLSQTANEFYGSVESFVASKVAPIFQSGIQSGSYYVSEIENLVSTADNLERAPGTAYGRVSMRLSQDSFNTVDRGIEVPVDDAVRAKYRDAWDADRGAIEKGVRTVLTDREVRLAALVTDASVTHEAMTTLTGSNGNTFLAEVDAEIEEIRKATGMRPNMLLLPITEYLAHLKHDTQLIDRIKNNGEGQISEVTLAAIANILNLQEVFVPGMVKASSKDGQAVTTADIWAQSEATLFYAPAANASLDAPASFRNFTWTEFQSGDDVAVTTYREQKAKSDIHQISAYDDFKMTGSPLTRQLTGL